MSRLVIGVDSSTQSTKAIAWNRNGENVAEGRSDIPLSTPSPGRFEQNPEDWWKAFCESTRTLAQKTDIREVDALAISNQRETVAYLDENSNSIYPAMLWLDERARDEVEELCGLVGKERILQITGRPPDTCPSVYRILWMKKNEPEIHKKVYCIADVQAFLIKRLCGEFHTGWISSDPQGMFDLQKKEWSSEIIRHLDIDTSQLPRTFPPGSLLGSVSKKASEQTGLKENLPIFAAGGDGQLAGLGTNCTTSDRAYINLGTAVVSGVWSKEYKYSNAWRTEIAAQGEGYIFETALKSGLLLVNWFVDQFMPGNRKDPDFFKRIEDKAARIPIGSDGLLTQPYWSAVMDPHWDTSARGTITGFNNSHTPTHIYRSILEGITIDQVMSTRTLEEESNMNIHEYLAIGGGARSHFWTQMLADASGKEVLISDTVEASSLGAAMIAAYASGWFDSIDEAAKTMSSQSELIRPDPGKKDSYAELLGIYKKMYSSTASINKELVGFASRMRGEST
jgi:xylulokinase